MSLDLLSGDLLWAVIEQFWQTCDSRPGSIEPWLLLHTLARVDRTTHHMLHTVDIQERAADRFLAPVKQFVVQSAGTTAFLTAKRVIQCASDALQRRGMHYSGRQREGENAHDPSADCTEHRWELKIERGGYVYGARRVLDATIDWQCTHAAADVAPLAEHAEPWVTEVAHARVRWGGANRRVSRFKVTGKRPLGDTGVLVPNDYAFTLHMEGLMVCLEHATDPEGAPSPQIAWGVVHDPYWMPRWEVLPPPSACEGGVGGSSA